MQSLSLHSGSTPRKVLPLLVILSLAIAGCAPATPSPTAAPAKPPATAAPAKKDEAKPAAKPTEKPAAKPADKAEPKPAAPAKPLPRTLSIGTNPAGTAAYAIAGALGTVAAKHLPTTVKPVPASGPNVWISQMEAREIEFGIMNVLDAGLAYRGEAEYKKPYKFLRLVSGGVFPFTGSILVKKDSDIRSISDLKGRRVASEFGGHVVTFLLQKAALATVGLTMNDVQPVPVPSVPAGVQAVAEGRAEASFSAIGIGTVDEANAAVGVRFLPLNAPDAKARVEKEVPGITVSTQRGGSAAGIEADIPVIAYPLHLVGSAEVAEDTVYQLTKVWWDYIEELTPIHAQMRNWTREAQVWKNFTIPYHPGTMRLFKELNLWTADMEALHTRLLNQ